MGRSALAGVGSCLQKGPALSDIHQFVRIAQIKSLNSNCVLVLMFQRWSIWWSSGLLVQRGRNRVNCRGGWDLWREQPLYRARESTNTGSGPKQRHLPLTQGCSLRHHHQSQSSWFVQIPSDQPHGVAKSMSECASKCGSNWRRAKC